MDYEEIQRYQAQRETILTKVSGGEPSDNDHIKWCLHLVDNEPDDLIRIYAKLWLEHHACDLAKRII